MPTDRSLHFLESVYVSCWDTELQYCFSPRDNLPFDLNLHVSLVKAENLLIVYYGHRSDTVHGIDKEGRL
jgi:hypothetical protein